VTAQESATEEKERESAFARLEQAHSEVDLLRTERRKHEDK